MEIHIPDLFDLQKITDSGQCFRAALLPNGAIALSQESRCCTYKKPHRRPIG